MEIDLTPPAGAVRSAEPDSSNALLVALITLACIGSLRVFGVTNGGSVNSSASTYADAVN